MWTIVSNKPHEPQAQKDEKMTLGCLIITHFKTSGCKERNLTTAREKDASRRQRHSVRGQELAYPRQREPTNIFGVERRKLHPRT